jgi:hypothetical protein
MHVQNRREPAAENHNAFVINELYKCVQNKAKPLISTEKMPTQQTLCSRF